MKRVYVVFFIDPSGLQTLSFFNDSIMYFDTKKQAQDFISKMLAKDIEIFGYSDQYYIGSVFIPKEVE